MTATLTKWYAEKGKHEIIAGGKKVALADEAHKLQLNAEDVAKGRQKDLDEMGIAKTAREEKIRQRDQKLKLEQDAKDREMERLYRKHVLGEKQPEGGFVPIASLNNGGIAPAKPASKKEEVGSFGD
jgi:hypothetical protein